MQKETQDSATEEQVVSDKRNNPKPAVAWLRRLGLGGFLFFLIKGLLWLLIPSLALYMGC